MVADRLVEQTKQKKNPCIVGLDPMWQRLPRVYTDMASPAEGVYAWAQDVIDAVYDIVPAVKPQMAYFEVFGGEGVSVFQNIAAYAHERGLLLIDDSKRGDIGSTAQAYAFAHLAEDGPIKADFLTVSPFLGTDSIQPFLDTAEGEGKGLFVLVKPSNPGSGEIGEARKNKDETVSQWLASYLAEAGGKLVGKSGYSALGAVVSSSRGILYGGEEELGFSRSDYQKAVRTRAEAMRRQVYGLLKNRCRNMEY